MKHLVILADGFADNPIERLGGKTPMMVAKTPNTDKLCSISKTGYVKTVPDSLHPGSEVANMTIMGYDAEKYYEGRGVLEAAALNIDLEPEDLVFRCNLITEGEGKIVNHSGGHVSTEEAKELMSALNDQLGSDKVIFYPGVSYRHVLIIKGGKNEGLHCTPPHDVPGELVDNVLPKGDSTNETIGILRELIYKSKDLLENHPVNVKRAKEGKPVANMVWPWSAGFRPKMPTLIDLYGIKNGAVISAVDLMHGIGKLGGLNSIFVEGATGLYTTNYAGKAEAALNALGEYDYVYLHIEAPDEAGHEGDVELKIRTLEDIDKYVVAPVLKYIEKNKDLSVAYLPDHPTPCELRTHTRADVPFMIHRPGVEPDAIQEYNETSVLKGDFGFTDQTEFMKLLLTGSKN